MINIKKQKMQELINAGKGLQNTLNAASEILGNPIAMLDIAYKLIAYTENKVTDDILWNELIGTGKFSHETVNFFRNEKFIEAYATSGIVSLMRSKKLNYDRANAVLFDKDGVQVANILVLACYRDFEKEDFELIELAAEAISAELLAEGYISKIYHTSDESLIAALIEDSVDEASATNNIKQFSQGLKPKLYTMVVDIMQYDQTLSHLVYFKEMLQEIQPEYKYYIYLNNIIIIIDAERILLNPEKELAKLNKAFKDSSLYAGISGVFTDLMGIKKHFKEALNALNYGMFFNSGKNIFKYDDFRMELLLNKNFETINPIYLCHPIMLYIHNYDKKNNTEYLDVLYYYMLKGFSVSLASERMDMPIKEFELRLKEIKKLFDIDWTNGNTLFSIFRSLKLLKCFPEKFEGDTNLY